MTTRTRTNRNTRTLSPMRKLEIALFLILTNMRDVLLGTIAMFSLIAVLIIGVLFVLLYTGTLTIEHISYITGDSYTVYKLHGVEFHSVQLTGNWLQQCFDIVVNVLGSIVQSIRNTF